LADVASDQQVAGLQATLTIDRDAAGRLGITPQMIDDALYDAYGQRQISTLYTQLNQYHVVMELLPNFQQTPNDLSQMYLRTSTGGKIPLDTLTRMQESSTPLTINHQGQFPVVTISFNLTHGGSLGDAVRAVDAAKQELGLPASIQARFQGTARAFQA